MISAMPLILQSTSTTCCQLYRAMHIVLKQLPCISPLSLMVCEMLKNYMLSDRYGVIKTLMKVKIAIIF